MRGFSVVELIVVIAITSLVMIMTVANYRDYQNRSVLDNQARDIALSIRLAQTYGLNVRGTSNDTFDTSYGIRLDDTLDEAFFIFRDTDREVGGYTYSGIAADQVAIFNLLEGYRITDVCADISGGGEHCFGANDIDWLDIVFDRPSPDAIFTSSSGGTTYDRAVIEITNPVNATSGVEVLLTGFISVQ